ncbi:uncharacterized protein PgNI_12121 [Pyricularia grisea]|uniref:Cyanovirin-N domain-containing protein n=1 Tax=Pyricularia grisea TaxID=148305 RepID=A0A6P8AQT0_PYRGI|nr:uncharacterized protein PgNI_12121 [Pyricularia grisea]TLD04398.1 hypothetical protein PgNI_12121 [Pyricularia grisea]
MQFFTLATLLLAATGANAASGLVGTCNKLKLSGDTLSAACVAANQMDKVTTSLELKDCYYVLGDGIAKCGRGGVGGCSFGSLIDPEGFAKVQITCPDSNSKQVATTVNLSELNATLTCI